MSESLSRAIRDASYLVRQLEDLNSSPIYGQGPPPSFSSAAIARADALLEDTRCTLESLRLRMAEIRSVRNSIAPITQIPPEILIAILELSLAGYGGRLRDVQKLTTVCHQWKRVIENTPSFWIHIDCNKHADLVRKAIKLSSPVPLTLSYNENTASLGNRPANFWLEVVMSAVGRCRELDLSLMRPISLRYLGLFDAPLLETLRLGMADSGEEEVQQPVTLFKGAAPKLRAVDFHARMPIDWQPDPFTNLRQLNIRHVRDTGPSISSLMTLLSNTPSLEELDLELDPSSLGPIPQGLQPVDLPRLHTLELGDLPDSAARYLMSHIRCPQCINFSIDLGPDVIPQSIFITAVERSLQAVDSVSKTKRGVVCLGLGQWTPDRFSSRGRSTTYGGVYRVAFYLPVWLTEEQLSYISHVVQNRLVNFEIDVTYYALSMNTGEPWLTFLSPLPHVTSLTIFSSDALGPLIQYLSSPRSVDGTLQWPHPQLTILECTERCEIQLGELLRMVRRRYGLDRDEEQSDVEPAAPFKLLTILVDSEETLEGPPGDMVRNSTDRGGG